MNFNKSCETRPSPFFRVGVSGLGKLGQFHLQKVMALSKTMPIQLTVVQDPDAEARAAALEKIKSSAQELGARRADCPSDLETDSFEEALKRADVLVLASPSQQHYVQAKMALEAGKHLFIEKPLALSSKEAFELCQKAQAKQVALGVGQNERLNPAFVSLRCKLETGLEPYLRPNQRPILLRFARESLYHPRVSGVSVVDDLMIHDLDLFLGLLKEFIDRDWKFSLVQARGKALASKEIDWAQADFEGILNTGEKFFISFFSSRVSPQPVRQVFLSSSEASCHADLYDLRLKILGSSRLDAFDFQKILLEQSFSPMDSLLEEQRQFFDALISGKRSVDQQAAEAVALAEEIKIKIKGNKF